MGGLVIDVEHIVAFDTDWIGAIKELPRKKGNLYFHTTDFVSWNDVYSSVWKGRYQEKLEILRGIAKVISKYSFQTFSAVLDMNDYALFDSYIKWSEVCGHPYAMACRIGYQQLKYWAQSNSIFDPIKMIVESRHGMGEVIESFVKDQLPPPSSDDKATPALQAADYIAWMRARRREPTEPYQHVKDSWKEISRVLQTDQIFGLPEFTQIARNIIRANEGKLLPARNDDNYKVIFNNSPKRIRTPFKRKPK